MGMGPNAAAGYRGGYENHRRSWILLSTPYEYLRKLIG